MDFDSAIVKLTTRIRAGDGVQPVLGTEIRQVRS